MGISGRGSRLEGSWGTVAHVRKELARSCAADEGNTFAGVRPSLPCFSLTSSTLYEAISLYAPNCFSLAAEGAMTGTVTVSIAEGAIVSKVVELCEDQGREKARCDGAATAPQLKSIPNVHPRPLIYSSSWDYSALPRRQ